MARAFCIPGVIFIFSAFVLSFLTSISLPFLSAIDITRTHFGSGVVSSGQGMVELRLGVWAPCYYDQNQARTCLPAGHGYQVSISNEEKTANVIIGPSWTRGLAIHPIATGVTFIALVLSASQRPTVMLFASLTSFLAALITLLAFAVDIALYAFLKHQVNKLPEVHGKTTASPGFWMTLATFILLLLAGCTVCFGRRQDRLSGATSYPAPSNSEKTIWSRFRKN